VFGQAAVATALQTRQGALPFFGRTTPIAPSAILFRSTHHSLVDVLEAIDMDMAPPQSSKDNRKIV
jgi:hypothetical protein